MGHLIVSDDLPAHLRQGLFAAPGTFPVIARLSSAPGDIQRDRVPTPRGMAIKVLGVPGPIFCESPDPAPNEDWLLVNSPAIPFGDIGSYDQVQKLVENRADSRNPDTGDRQSGWRGETAPRFGRPSKCVRRSPASLKHSVPVPTLILSRRHDPAEEPGLSEASLKLCPQGSSSSPSRFGSNGTHSPE